MASQYEAAVASFYLAYYGRPADPAGLAFWAGNLERAGGDFSLIIQAFSTSAEATARFADITPAQRLDQIYQELFGRKPDAAGLDFWSKAIDAGAVSLPDAVLAVMQGAQGADLTLNQARQGAAEAFTARISQTGAGYDGMAATEVGRLLVQAVGTHTKNADLQAMLDAATRLAQAATDAPVVIEALAADGKLAALLQLPKAGANPVALVQALAETARIAAGNPATLDALLRGGRMEQVLTVMPQDATLEQVVTALEQGGLPAAVQVVYPPEPEPDFTMTIGLGDQSPGFTEMAGTGNGSNAQVINSDMRFSGIGAVNSATVTITNTKPGDELVFVDTAKIKGAVTIDDHGNKVLTLSAKSGQSLANADFEAALETVKFNNTSDTPDTTTRNIEFKVSDGSATSAAATEELTVNATNDGPVGSVTIAGAATEDQVLTAANTITDADGLGQIGYTWQRADTVSGTYSDIAGATSQTYALGDADVGKFIRVVASYTDAHGTAESVISTPTAAVANVNDAPAGSVTIAGTAAEDQVLTAANTIADADGLGPISYSWQRADTVSGAYSDIAGATSQTYTLGDADVGKFVRVVASYTDAHDTAESVASTPTAAVANVNDAPGGSVTIAGAATEDQVLTAANTIADADGLGQIGYRWQRADTVSGTYSDIAGATSQTYALGDADVGKFVRVVASYTDAHGTPESVISTPTAAVANVNDAPTGIILSASTVAENSTAGTEIAALSALDEDAGDSFTYALATGDGSTDADNGLVEIVGDKLRVKMGAVIDFETNPSLAINVKVKDAAGASYVKALTVNVTDVNEAPTVANAIADQKAVKDTAFSFQVPGNAFADVDAGTTLSYSATLADGNALPAWLSFDAATRTFSGTPLNADVGTFNIKVTASDGAAPPLSVSDTFALTVPNNQILTGGPGSDTLVGGDGDDVITGNAGTDRLTGGGGADVFVFAAGDTVSYAFNDVNADTRFTTGDTFTGSFDVITDFTSGVDRIDLSSSVDYLKRYIMVNGTDTVAYANPAATHEFYVTGRYIDGVFTVNAIGLDTLVFFNGGMGKEAIVLIGVTNLNPVTDLI